MGKVLVGRTQKGQFDSVEINLGPEDFQKIESLKRKGWARLYISKSMKNGNPYCYLWDGNADTTSGSEKVAKIVEKEDLGF
jgi:hypothetical protein